MQEDREVQQENSKQYYRMVFVDNITTIVATYIANINKYVFDNIRVERINEELKSTFGEFQKNSQNLKKLYEEGATIDALKQGRDSIALENKIKKAKIEYDEWYFKYSEKLREKESIIVNRERSVQCYYSLKMKLCDIAPAGELLKELTFVHEKSGEPSINIEAFSEATDRLSDATIEFSKQYTKYN